MTIYKLINKKNGKAYVGMTIGDPKQRILAHLGVTQSGTCLLSKAIKKFGRKNFYSEIVDTASTRKELGIKEIYWIDKLNTIHPDGYNYHKGGQGGNNSGTISRKKAVKCITTGQTFSGIIETSIKYNLNRTIVADVCHGYTDTAHGFEFEFIDKNLKKISDLTRKNRIAKASKAFKKAMAKFNAKKRLKVRCISLNKEFESLTVASKKTGVKIQSICYNCNGRMDSAGGLIFEFVDSYKKRKANIVMNSRRKNTKIKKLINIKKAAEANKKTIKCVTTGEIFGSIREAANKINVHESAVSQVLRKIRKSINGLIFAYEKHI